MIGTVIMRTVDKYIGEGRCTVNQCNMVQNGGEVRDSEIKKLCIKV